MKRNKLILATLTAALTFSAVPASFVNAPVVALADTVASNPKDIRQLLVTYMDSFAENYLGDNALKEDVTKDYGNSNQKVSYTYEFKIDKPSYVNICAAAKAFKYNFYGEYELYLSTSKDTFTKQLAKTFADGTRQTNYIMSLEPGTYYLRLDLVPDGYYFMDGSYTYVNVVAQPLKSRTGNALGDSMQTAIPLTKGEASNGAITGMDNNNKIVMETNCVPQQYFKVTLPKSSKLSLSLVATKCFGITNFDSNTISMKVLDKTGKELYSYANQSSTPNSITTTTEKSLPKGTYYIKVSRPGHCEMTLTANYSGAKASSKKAIKPFKVTAKTGKKNITVNSVKKASVKIKLGKKSYKGKTNAKGKAVIKTAKLKKGTGFKVTVSKSGYKTTTKSFKVK